MSSPPDPLRRLQAAARTAARHVAPGVQPAEVIVKCAAGRKIVVVHLPPADPDAIDPEPGPRPGWDFAHGGCKFDGAPVPVRGRSLDVLRVLAAADGPAPAEKLKRAWADYDVAEKTVRYQVGELRKVLAELFPTFEGDIIQATGSGYVLLLR